MKCFLTFATLVIVAPFLAGQAMAQSFTCPIGKQPSCLDYSDKVCSSFSKCIDQNAVCFDSYQCDYNGFTCKSNVLDIAKKHDALVDDYNQLIRTSKALSVEYDDLLEKSRRLADEYDDLKARADEFQRCIQRASTLDETEYCRL